MVHAVYFSSRIMFCGLEMVVEWPYGFARLIETASQWIENRFVKCLFPNPLLPNYFIHGDMHSLSETVQASVEFYRASSLSRIPSFRSCDWRTELPFTQTNRCGFASIWQVWVHLSRRYQLNLKSRRPHRDEQPSRFHSSRAFLHTFTNLLRLNRPGSRVSL
jgi:hypothetical protein